MESWSVTLLQCCLSGFGGRPVFCYGVTFSWLQVAEENKQNKTTHCLMKGAHQNQGRGILSPMAVPQCPLSIKFNILPASTVEIFIAPFIFFFQIKQYKVNLNLRINKLANDSVHLFGYSASVCTSLHTFELLYINTISLYFHNEVRLSF